MVVLVGLELTEALVSLTSARIKVEASCGGLPLHLSAREAEAGGFEFEASLGYTMYGGLISKD